MIMKTGELQKQCMIKKKYSCLIIGLGNIGMMYDYYQKNKNHLSHVSSIIKSKDFILYGVVDNDKRKINIFLKKYKIKTFKNVNEVDKKKIDLIIISTPSSTHFSVLKKVINRFECKAILCEKPIDLDINKVNQCYKEIKDLNAPIHIGFNRRFDKSNKYLKLARDNGEIGNLEMIVITSRDPSPSTIDYHKSSGGLFRDCTIHDFDLSRFILGNDEIVEISAYASQLVNEDIKKIGDHDTAMILMKSKKGVLIHINNSRRAVYGYDQRVEIFGSKGMLLSNNQTPTSVEKFNETGTFIKEPIYNFFIERYDQAYKAQLDDFVEKIENKQQPSVTFEDGRKALILANTAYKSLENNSSTKVEYEF